MTEEQKIFIDGMVRSSNIALANSLTFLKSGLEAFRNYQKPILSKDGMEIYGFVQPYKQDKNLQEFVDFMIVFCNRSLEMVDTGNKEEEEKINAKVLHGV